MSQAAFAALFLTNATATRAGIRRHKKARSAGYSSSSLKSGLLFPSDERKGMCSLENPTMTISLSFFA